MNNKTEETNARILAVCSALEPLQKSFDTTKHPHGYHGWFAHTLHAPADDPGSGSAPSDDPTRRQIVVATRAAVPSAEEILRHEGTERMEDWFLERHAQKSPEEMGRALVEMLPDAGIGLIRRATPKFQNWIGVWNNARMGEQSIPDELFALHLAAADVFGSPVRLNMTRRPGAVEMYQLQGKPMRAFIHAMYAWTQQELKRRGIEDVVVWRGLKGDRGRRILQAEGLQQTEMENYPIAAFSIDQEVAVGFAGPEVGALMVTRIPAPRLFATPLTGIGVWGQREALMGSGERDLCYQAYWESPATANLYRNVPLVDWVQLIQEQERKNHMAKSLTTYPQCNPAAQREAVRRLNEDERNIFGGTAPVSEERRATARQDRLRLHQELFGDKAR